MKIMLLEDDIILSEIIEEFLQGLQYRVTTVYDGIEAENTCFSQKFDLLLLDVNVPHVNGFEFLQNLREIGDKTPAIFITSLDGADDLKLGFDSGCDDYIKKPFELSELEIRINNIKRLYNIENSHNIKISDDLVFDKKNLLLYKDNQEIKIPKKEASILEFFLLNKNKTLTPKELSHNIWSYEDAPTESTIRTYIKNLRKLIGNEYIDNIRGVGYRFNQR